jgi:anion-transporting  ArsA/GET3 family ATPase
VAADPTGEAPTGRARRPRHLDLDALIDDLATRTIVCCGSGGVGKTTTAAALALRAAARGRKVVVLTIDPARRLAQSMGLEELDNEPRPVPGAVPEGSVAEGPGGAAGSGGELQAMMLDMRRTFDEMVLGHTTPDRAQAIFDNPFYQTISTSFSGTQEYMAMEKLGQLAATGRWDLIIVDTPPSRSALDFLDAPQRLSSFLDGRMIRLLSAPARAGGSALRKLVGSTFNLFAKAVSTILGGQMLADASAFVQAFDTLFGGFQERANATYQLLRAPGTAFLVVASPEPDALREASYFVERLGTEKMPLAGMVLNRTHPVHATLSGARAREGAETLEAARGDATTAAVLRLHADRVETAERERRVLARFTRAHPNVPIVDVPAMATDVHDLDGLRAIGELLAS